MKSFYRERRHVCGKTIASAKYQEVDIYPMTGTDASRAYDKEAAAPRRLPTRKAQANLNDRNARRHLVQLVITNFDEHDLHVTLTYGPGQEPTTEAEARRDRDNFVRRLAAANKKAGGAPLKYIIVTEHKDADPAAGVKGIRYHHHVILSCGLDRDKIESLWRTTKMTIDDISALKQAHALLKGRHLAEFIPTVKGISACYFNAVQAARRIYSESIGAFVPLFAKHEYGLNSTYFLADGIPVYYYDLKTRKPDTALPPASCYRIHLTTPDPEGESI